MKTSPDTKLFFNEDKLVGIALQGGYAAEHEIGFKEIGEDFYLNSKKLGFDRYKVNKIPEYFIHGEFLIGKSKYYYLSASHYITTEENAKSYFVNHFSMRNRLLDICSSWSNRGFFIASRQPESCNHLKDLANNFQSKNISFYFGKMDANPFGTFGLYILVRDRINKKESDDLITVHKDAIRLEKIVEKTGIEKKLKKAGKFYYALSPQLQEDGTLLFWLNPPSGTGANYGWFTLEDLELWIKDKGPIVAEKGLY